MLQEEASRVSKRQRMIICFMVRIDPISMSLLCAGIGCEW
jgi:hypothetical protein